jgi:hypothetical protein
VDSSPSPPPPRGKKQSVLSGRVRISHKQEEGCMCGATCRREQQKNAESQAPGGNILAHLDARDPAPGPKIFRKLRSILASALKSLRTRYLPGLSCGKKGGFCTVAGSSTTPYHPPGFPMRFGTRAYKYSCRHAAPPSIANTCTANKSKQVCTAAEDEACPPPSYQHPWRARLHSCSSRRRGHCP